MIGLLISLIILLVIFAVAWWILGMIPVPAEFRWVVNVVFALIFLICFICLLTGNMPIFVHYPLR